MAAVLKHEELRQFDMNLVDLSFAFYRWKLHVATGGKHREEVERVYCFEVSAERLLAFVQVIRVQLLEEGGPLARRNLL